MIDMTCEACGERRRVKRPAGRAPRFCSMACRSAASLVALPCAHCGEQFTAKRFEGRLFCSPRCAYDAHTGRGHHAFVGRRIEENGYVAILMPTHPDARGNGYVYEHRLVMEESIGRRLRPEEVVHHINRVRCDNSEDNLQLFPNRSAHTIQHLEDACIL